MTKKRRSGGREKTLEERRAYHQRLGTQTASTTETQGFSLGSASNSTSRRPSVDDDDGLGVIEPSSGARPRSQANGVNWTAVGTVVAIVGLVGGAVLYVENIKSHMQVTETRITSIEKARDVAETALRRDLQRIEGAVERRLGEILALFRDGSRKPLATQNDRKEISK